VHTGAKSPVTQLHSVLVGASVIGERSQSGSADEADSLVVNVYPTTMSQRVRTPREKGFRAKNLRIPEFNSEGSMAVEHWLNAIDRAVQADECELDAPWPQRPLYFAVGASLRGNAATWFLDHNARISNAERTFERLSELLRAQYGSRETLESVTARLNRRSQEPGETFADYAVALRKLADKVHVPTATLVHSFLEGLSMDAVHFVRSPTFRTLEAAVEHAEKVFSREWTEESAKGAKKRAIGERPRLTGRPVAPTLATPILSVSHGTIGLDGEDEVEEGEVAQVRAIQHWTSPNAAASAAQIMPPYPFHPTAPYHPTYPTPMPYYPYPPQYQPMQWQPPQGGRKRPSDGPPETRPGKSARTDVSCWHCLQTGHYRRDCPSQRRGEPPAPRTGTENSYASILPASQQPTPSSN